jgi:predicted nucleotidyltransferase
MVACLSPQEIQLIQSFLKEKLAPSFIWLFGSGAQEALKPDSDVDLAFFSDARSDSYQVFMIAQELAAMLGREVDLIDLRKASTVMKAQIVGKGKLIYEQNPFQRKMFTMRVFKEYALLNEERKPILDRFTNPEV